MRSRDTLKGLHHFNFFFTNFRGVSVMNCRIYTCIIIINIIINVVVRGLFTIIYEKTKILHVLCRTSLFRSANRTRYRPVAAPDTGGKLSLYQNVAALGAAAQFG